MPPGRTKEDTWKSKDLEKSLKEVKDDRRRHKEGDRDKDRERHRDRDKDRDKDKEHRKKDKNRDDDERRHHRKDDERKERRPRDKENDERPKDDEERRKRREERKKKELQQASGRSAGRDQKPRPKPKDDGERRHRDKDERRHRDDRDDRRHRDDKDERRHRSDRDERHHRDDKERRSKHRDDEERRGHRDREDDGRKHRDGERRHRDKDDERRPRDKDDTRRHRDRDEDQKRKDRDAEDEEKRKRHEERRERKKREQEEKEREEKERKAKEEEEDEGDYNYDDEDFEDYDDDFEDEDKDEDDEDDDDSRSTSTSEEKNVKPHFKNDMEEIAYAMNQENKRLGDAQKNRYTDDTEEKSSRARPTTASKRTFINFVSAKQRQVSTKAAGKTALRAIELQEMVELEKIAYEMFDMPPITEYNMYIRSFGSSNTKQAYIQTNDDNIDKELQTEDIEYSEKWTQHPMSETASSGGKDGEKSSVIEEDKPVDSLRLGQFMERAGQVINILLDEEFMNKQNTQHARSKQSNIIVSEAFTEFTLPSFLKERPVIESHFSSVQTHMLLTVHTTPEEQSSDPLTRQGCICVWNVNEPSHPQKVLMCESQPRCCCFSPTKTNLVFGGMTEGSVIVWDLRENASMHKIHRDGNEDVLLRYPTYNTAGVLHYENHQSAVHSIQPIVTAGESASASLSGLAHTESGEGLSFQLATLEENGVLHLWVVAELLHPDPAGSESDYGLSPGGRVKIVKSFKIQLESPLRDNHLRTTMKCVDMQLLPSNNSHYYVASDTGCVLHGLRYGGKSLPKAYWPVIDNLVQVTSVDFSPFTEPVFLAGCADGSLRLYHVDTEWPLVSWASSTDGRPIQQVLWCRSRPAVFFVLDDTSHLHIWDLLMDDSGPLKREAISKARVTSLSLSNDHSATGLGLPGRRPQMVVGLDNGVCEIHTVSQQFSALMGEEIDQFAMFLQKNG